MDRIFFYIFMSIVIFLFAFFSLDKEEFIAFFRINLRLILEVIFFITLILILKFLLCYVLSFI